MKHGYLPPVLKFLVVIEIPVLFLQFSSESDFWEMCHPTHMIFSIHKMPIYDVSTPNLDEIFSLHGYHW